MKKSFEKPVLKLGLVVAIGTLWVSCATVAPTVQKSDMDAVDQSMELPERNITAYDDALYQLGRMLTAYSRPTTRVYCRPIVNATASGSLPSDVTQLTQTAISKIGPKFQYIDIDRKQLSVDLARNETSMERVIPDLAIKGAITEYDLKLEQNSQKEGDVLAFVGEGQIDAGFNEYGNASAVTMAMDYLMLDYETQMSIPFVQGANRMNLYTSTEGSDYGISVLGTGFGVNCRVKRSQGLHAGLRLLVELNVLEIIGKYHRVPYWRCLPNGQVDERLVDRYVQEIKSDPNALTTMKWLAYAHGCEMDLHSTGLSANEIEQLLELKQHYGLDPNEQNDYEFMKRMWLNLPFETAADRMAQVPDPETLRNMQIEAERRAQAEAMAAEANKAREEAAAEAEKKRTTLKFGAQETF